MNLKIPQTDLELDLSAQICYLGVGVANQKNQIFAIKKDDRRSHVYVLGKTGMGKTTLLQNMVLQDIYNGFGVCFLDPHGDSSEYILNRIPKHRQNEVIYLDPSDINYPIGLNILENQNGEEPYLVASNLMAVFNRIWSGSWSSRMEYILNNTLLALLETPGNTLLGVIKMLTDEGYRGQIVEKLRDPLVRNFWQKEFASFNSRYQQEAISPILNKIGQFFSSELMRNILGQEKSTINLREIMDSGKILIVNLSKGRLGEDNSNLFGSLLVAKLQTATFSRVDTPEDKRKDFFLYVDEFQNFTTDSFATILSEARKYRLNLILAHQYVSQLTESGNKKVKNAVFGNVGNIITFRLGSQDVEELSREFSPFFGSQDLISLDAAQIIARLSSKTEVSKPFKANTLASIFQKLNGSQKFITEISRHKYARSRDQVSSQIANWFEPEKPAPKDQKKNLNSKKTPQKPPEKEPETKSPSENILNLHSKKLKRTVVSVKNQLKFTKNLQNSTAVTSDKIRHFDHQKEKDGQGFGVPE